ncbi:MAG: apolipoprotein N-acyltransferase, partial [Flavobacteriales bacterium]|nr:apolipoprotein N-acyltransferase [Flavobacteriales bacterium]
MRKILLSVLSGLILAFSWPETGVFPLIFIAFIPLLILEKEISESGEKTSWKVFGYSFISFFIFNIITTYWVWHATVAGAFAAFVINTLLMSFAFVLFHKVKNVLGNKRGYFSLIFLWISMEYLHLHWELAWPWLTLGNVFATIPDIVQWYEYTGVLGGSLWILG